MPALSFALPAYDGAMARVYDQVFTGLHMLDSLLRLFPPRAMHHQGKTRQVSNPQVLDTTMHQHRATVSVEPEMFVRTDLTLFCEFLVSLIMDLQNQRKAHILEVLSQTADATGNHIDGKDRNVWDTYLEALEKVDFGFDYTGKPLAKFYVPSELATKFTAVLPTDEQLKRAREIIESKREKHFGTKRYRRLHLTVAES